jgi:hypothetical protein
MALQINQEIETINKGIVTNPYLRIEAYRIDKILGVFLVTTAMFRDKADADSNKFVYHEDYAQPSDRIHQTGPIATLITYNDNSFEYPVVVEFPLGVPEVVTEDIYEDQEVTRTIVYNDFDENGDIVEKTREETTIEKVKTGTHEVTKSKMDISVIGEDPYGWAYAKLKTHYEGIFGAENVIDC